ncbi:MAG: glycosyltransferase family 4 protein [Candidatus Aminicenantes bacterium]|nr:glycosyltransferase family 4 protein [Candidatus Aminicenantes bacterium]
MSQKKIAFIVQRYGREVMGGSELHCRQVAEQLTAAGFDCTVYTTCAKDYITWKNEYPAGETFFDGIRIKRYLVDKERDILAFNAFSDKIFHREHTADEEIRWMEMQGPCSPALIGALEKEGGLYDALIFFTYLYYNTYWGLKRSTGRKILVPTAHDEPALHLDMMKEVFAVPEAFIYNTTAERDMLKRYFPLEEVYGDIVGVGIPIAESPSDSSIPFRYGLFSPYILYAGRIEEGKGCGTMIDSFLSTRRLPDMSLALIGKKLMELPEHPRIHYLGFVSPSDKNGLMAGAMATVHPSPYESLCMAALESLAVGTPILVREGTEPLRRHAVDGRCGLTFSDPADFREALFLLSKDRELRSRMGQNGRRYVGNNYSWPAVVEKYKRAFFHLLGS